MLGENQIRNSFACAFLSLAWLKISLSANGPLASTAKQSFSVKTGVNVQIDIKVKIVKEREIIKMQVEQISFDNG